MLTLNNFTCDIGYAASVATTFLTTTKHSKINELSYLRLFGKTTL